MPNPSPAAPVSLGAACFPTRCRLLSAPRYFTPLPFCTANFSGWESDPVVAMQAYISHGSGGWPSVFQRLSKQSARQNKPIKRFEYRADVGKRAAVGQSYGIALGWEDPDHQRRDGCLEKIKFLSCLKIPTASRNRCKNAKNAKNVRMLRMPYQYQ